MIATLMQMYCTAKVDIPEDFRSKFNQYMTVMRITIAQCIQNRGDKFLWLSPTLIPHM